MTRGAFDVVKAYYQLTKPGIVYGNAFTTLAAFLFASEWQFPLLLLAATLIGIALVIASACVFNNYLDRDVDLKMARTKERALATRTIATTNALLYGAALGVVGSALLFLYVNALTACLALFGFIFYVVIYGVAKRASHWGTVVGSISGAIPILAGYTAVMGRLDAIGLILFLILVLWQMPHFYAIALYRIDDYRGAGIPVLPIQKGIRVTKILIASYIAAFTIAVSILPLFISVGYTYRIGVALFGLAWLWRGMRGFKTEDTSRWGRGLFFFSLIVLVAFCLLLSIARILP